jgi:hypothetical protein
MTQSSVDFKALAEPFFEDEYEHRLSQAGTTKEGKIWAQSLTYVQARAIMNRLDDIVGPQNWQVKYEHNDRGVMCSLSVKCGDEWITKCDGSDYSDIEAFKGGISGALKRAAVLFGPGRLLYDLDAGFATIVERGTKGARQGKTKDGQTFYWLPPALPKWAVKQVKEEAPKEPTKPAPKAKTAFDAAPKTIQTLVKDQAAVAAAGDHLIEVGTPGGPIRGKYVKDLTNAPEIHKSLNNMIKSFSAQGKTVDAGFKTALEKIELHFALKG